MFSVDISNRFAFLNRYIIKEWKKKDNALVNVKLLLQWRPAVHIIYLAEANKDEADMTDVTISIEAQYEYFDCQHRNPKSGTVTFFPLSGDAHAFTPRRLK